jgi:hypothetical protein
MSNIPAIDSTLYFRYEKSRVLIVLLLMGMNLMVQRHLNDTFIHTACPSGFQYCSFS